ncbi:cell division protein FtsL [Aliikangiella sp. G2MR2-5]|uniref:cell division protein FtsL n=1 Tax=Aliikangiella sp. G2MR2-5 TaxID=2788943 RepID=UPI0018ABBADA|nr:cell division protein FtsL [Aliikangiella sp. G2MR2-5]
MTAKKDKKSGSQAPSLLKALVQDIFVRHFYVTLLAILVVASGMQLAHTSHDSRRLTAMLQAEKQEQRDLQIQWDSLRLELTALSEAARISTKAKTTLGMKEVTIQDEKVISL